MVKVGWMMCAILAYMSLLSVEIVIIAVAPFFNFHSIVIFKVGTVIVLGWWSSFYFGLVLETLELVNSEKLGD